MHDIKINTGKDFEELVYQEIINLVNRGRFLVSNPYVKIYMGKEYYSKERLGYIKTDVSIEKYFDEITDKMPELIIIVECKDYKSKINIDELEEFHSKLQQIGADNTKGILITRNASFSKSAKAYAKSMGISLAKLEFEKDYEFTICYKKGKIYFLIIALLILFLIKYQIFLCVIGLILIKMTLHYLINVFNIWKFRKLLNYIL